MRVKELMRPPVGTCHPTTSLTRAAATMWEGDTGGLPVINEKEQVIGFITDRDICMAVALKNRAPHEIAVGEVFTGRVFACSPEDDVSEALRAMKEHKVHRLPVVGSGGRLEGIVTMTDFVRIARSARSRVKPSVTCDHFTAAYRGIHESAWEDPQDSPAGRPARVGTRNTTGKKRRTAKRSAKRVGTKKANAKKASGKKAGTRKATKKLTAKKSSARKRNVKASARGKTSRTSARTPKKRSVAKKATGKKKKAAKA